MYLKSLKMFITRNFQIVLLLQNNNNQNTTSETDPDMECDCLE